MALNGAIMQHQLAADAPVKLSVRNTFLEEAECPRSPARLRTWSEPVCFKPSGEDMTQELSSSSTETSDSDVAHDAGEPRYVPTPTRTVGQPLTLSLLEALGDKPAEPCKDEPGSRKSSHASSHAAPRTPDRSETNSRRVYFSSVQDVVHIPKASAPVSPLTVVASPPRPPSTLTMPPTYTLPSSTAAASAAEVVVVPPVPPAPAGSCKPAAEGRPSRHDARAQLGAVVGRVQAALEAGPRIIACVEAKEGPRGWTLTAYVQPQALKANRAELVMTIQQILAVEVAQSGCSVLLGYATGPFTMMPLGFGAAIAELPEPQRACWSSFARGFCDNPGGCTGLHPACQVGINIMLKPARRRRPPEVGAEVNVLTARRNVEHC